MKLLAALTFGSLALSAALSAGTTTPAAWLGPDPHPVVIGLPGTSGWPAAVAAVAPDAAAPDPAAVSVGQTRALFAALTPAQQHELARRAPGVVGNLDGAPYHLRHVANTHAWQSANPDLPPPAGHLLGYDPRGDGRLIQGFGDLDAAEHVAVIVPGSGWSLATMRTGAGPAGAHPVTNARTLLAELTRLDAATSTRVAVVVWLGYDAPEDVDRQAMRSERAVRGARALTRFVAGLPAGAHVSVLCHSYGAVLCGHAAGSLGTGDELVALAAPGMDAETAAELGTTARVWAARTPDDPIRFTPDVRLGGFGHGADPVSAGFGAQVLATGSASGHDAYYAQGTESLTNLARVVLGHADQVTNP